MALPAHLLEKLPTALISGSSRILPADHAASDEVDALRVPGLEAVLPDHGLPRGAVTELAVDGATSVATSIALAACRTAQRSALETTTASSASAGARAATGAGWCAFIDPSGTLYGPGVAAAGVELERLLVVRPSLEALSRVALKVVESRVFSVVVIDTKGVPGASLDVNLGAWPRVVRRLGLSIEKSKSSVLLLTDKAARRPLPLPVAMRLELRRTSKETLTVTVAKERHGRVSSPRAIAWVERNALPRDLLSAVSPSSAVPPRQVWG